MKHTPRIRVLVVAMSLALGASACGDDGATTTTDAAPVAPSSGAATGAAASTTTVPKKLTKITVQLSNLANVQHFGVTYAAREGLYAAEGLDVTYVEATNAVDPMQVVDAGQAQIGIAGAERLVIAKEKGINTTVFAAQYQKSPQATTCRKDSGVTSLKELGKTTVGLKTSSGPGFAALTKINGVDQGALKITPIADNDVASIIAGKIGCQYGSFAINEPITMKLQGVEPVVFLNADNGLAAQGNAYFTTPAYYAAHKDDVIVPFLRATMKAWQIFLDNPDAAAKYAVDKNLVEGLKLDHQTAMAQLQAPLMFDDYAKANGLLALNAAAWKSTASAVFETGSTKSLIDTSQMLVTDAYATAKGK